MSLNNYLSDLRGTLMAFFRIATTAWKDSSGEMQARDSGDTEFADVAVQKIRLAGSNETYRVDLQAPAGLGADVAWTFPATHGSAGQVLADDGDGNLYTTGAVSNAALWQEEDFTEATSSPLTIFTPPANATILAVEVKVSSAASAGSPTLSVGVAGTVERDMAADKNDLKTLGLWRVRADTEVGGTPGAVIATITPDSQTFTGKVRVEYAIPA